MTAAEYRMRRLMSFMDPWSDASGSGFHVIQSLIAFGSGQLWGRGLGESRQKLFYLPEAHTDFVFSVIGEELGLLGAFVVLALFGVIILRGLRLTSRIEEPFDQYLAFGLTVLLGFQALIHMGVVMGLDADQGTGAAVYQLWRLSHADQSGGGRHFAEPIAPEGIACG